MRADFHDILYWGVILKSVDTVVKVSFYSLP